jgi:hypothetical protein
VNNTCISRGFASNVASITAQYYPDVTTGEPILTGGMTGYCATNGETAYLYSYDAADWYLSNAHSLNNNSIAGSRLHTVGRSINYRWICLIVR